ncbi:uncharacterized protein LOC113548131 [Rhopalosiphum maidis]|uniref:uncharacterized protein LOC113548131 n=1 Tax=Rhopalosiphum maidis TaxID=43146 RepID=UPI000F00B7E7|nr:uncharacterized protein LOC113548131 [Rhopalosiphum maidis]
MNGSFDLAAYLVILLVASALANVDEDYDYTYTNFFPELSNHRSGLDSTDADPHEIHEFRKAVPKLATVRDDDGLLFRSTTLRPIITLINVSGADRRLGQTTVVKKHGGVPWPYATDFNRKVLFPSPNLGSALNTIDASDEQGAKIRGKV